LFFPVFFGAMSSSIEKKALTELLTYEGGLYKEADTDTLKGLSGLDHTGMAFRLI